MSTDEEATPQETPSEAKLPDGTLPVGSDKKCEETKAINESNAGAATTTSEDETTSSESAEDSDTDFSPSEDPEVLLIKASTLKEEGNNHFKNKDFEKAARAYRRGTSALKPLNKQNTGDEQVKALLVSLQTNLSMMCFKQEKYRQSCQVASAVLKIDNVNVKALYRRALANRKLGDHDEARADLKEALKQDPNNSAVKKEFMSLRKEMENNKKTQRMSLQKAFSKGGGGLLYDDKEQTKRRKEDQQRLLKKQEEEKLKKRKLEWEDECVKRMAKGEQAISFEDWDKECAAKEEALAKEKAQEEKKKKEERRKAREATRNQQESDSEEELTEKELAQLRGYKKTADGRVTSYFTREQTHKEKSIIGDITPKRLDATPTAEAPTQLSHTGTKGNPSKWNQAGTWEEKDTTDWCRDRLISRLKETKTEADSLAGVITEVKDLTGHASVAIVSGKKRYIFDFHCKLSFEVRDPETDDIYAKGSFKLPDICSTHHEELEVTFEAWKKSPDAEHRHVVSDCLLALTSEVRESVKLWVADFNNAY